MKKQRSNLEPLQGANRSLRSRLDWKSELLLATAPTVVVLGVLALVEVLSRQRLLFASLASSAFLIYLDPQHGTNTVRTLMISQIMAAIIGFAAYSLLGSGYIAGGTAMVITIVLMILLDVMHPPTTYNFLECKFLSGFPSHPGQIDLILSFTTKPECCCTPQNFL